MPIHAPNIGFWDFTPKMGNSMNKTPKKNFLAQKHVVWRIDCHKQTTGAVLAQAEE